jgi:hypothetical protein
MAENIKRKRGAPPGNRNALKHGFFSSAMTPSELCEFWQNLKSGSGDRELAAFRTKLNSALRAAPGNRRVLQEASRLLTKWFCSKNGLYGKDRTDIKKLIRYAFSEIGKQFYKTNRISLSETAPQITKRIEAEK